MAYIDDNLLPNERVIYRARLHKVVLLTVFAFLFIVLLIELPVAVFLLHFSGWLALGLWALVCLYMFMQYRSTEVGITDRRLIVKHGFIRRQVAELPLARIESITFDQPILGRILGYGTIIVTGTGGTRQRLRTMAAPQEFRRQLQARIAGSGTL